MTAVHTALVAAAAAKPKSSSASSILIFVVIGAAFYFLIYRPQQKKQKAARSVTNTFEVGDEVVTAGGIVGHVLDITDDRVTLETSVGASFVVLKPYVLRKLEPAEPPTDVVDSEVGTDDPSDGTHDGGPTPPTTPPPSDAADVEADRPSTKPQAPEGDGPDSGGPDSPPII